jgi:hypothetical protein
VERDDVEEGTADSSLMAAKLQVFARLYEPMLRLHTCGIAFADAKVQGDSGPFG